MPAPMTRYSVLTMEQERRHEAIREQLPIVVFVGLLALWGATACALVSERHRNAKLEAACSQK